MVAIIMGSPGRRLPCLNGRLPRACDVNGEVNNVSVFGCCIRREVVAGIGGIHAPPGRWQCSCRPQHYAAVCGLFSASPFGREMVEGVDIVDLLT